MKKRVRLVTGAVAAVAVVGIGAGVAVAGDRGDKPLRGSDRVKATAAALDHTGEGRVTDTETGDDGAAFGVEILLDNGSQVEVQIDQNFNVTGSEPDEDGTNDD